MNKGTDNLIYGIHAIMETIESGKHFERIFIQKNLKGDLILELKRLIKKREIPSSFVPIEKINRLTKKNHQGVVAFVSPIQYYTIEHVLPAIYERGEVPLILVLDGITDVRNFGGIARSAECMGVHAIVIPNKGNVQINADAIKTSAGALNYLPICRTANLNETVYYLKDSGLQLLAASERANKELPFVSLEGPLAVIMGAEDVGISSDLLSIADHIVRIPQTGQVNSLNVGAAASMIIYEIIRQRLVTSKPL